MANNHQNNTYGFGYCNKVVFVDGKHLAYYTFAKIINFIELLLFIIEKMVYLQKKLL